MRREVEFSVESATGIITLDRPEAINALNSDMVEAIDEALARWADDDGVRAVLIEGRGEKGLCAGGDVRATREMVLAGQKDNAFAFFATEYRMNERIARYGKPIIALQRGIVMGGGIGLSSHARFRIATETSRFAMPEAAIGFFCDVGVNALLYKTTQARALAFLLSGKTVGAADAMALGLTDSMVLDASLEGLRRRLIEAAGAADVDTAIAAVIQSESANAGPAEFCALADSLAGAFDQPDMSNIVDHLDILADEGDPGAAAFLHTLLDLCPTSLAISFLAHRQARRDRDVGLILKTDLQIARFMVVRPDFAEGVRAVLVDRDRNARWEPQKIGQIDMAALEAVMAK